jgi:putative colanic acid biosynthesis acetyltransferase WcaF
VDIKPGVRIKFPWRLKIGDHSWIGEDVWIDNLAEVSIGSHCCISQGAYLCTGSHDWTKSSFDLIIRSIHLGDRSWIAARCVVGPGVRAGEGSVLALGSVATEDLAPWSIYTGSPATLTKTRRLKAAT